MFLLCILDVLWVVLYYTSPFLYFSIIIICVMKVITNQLNVSFFGWRVLPSSGIGLTDSWVGVKYAGPFQNVLGYTGYFKTVPLSRVKVVKPRAKSTFDPWCTSNSRLICQVWWNQKRFSTFYSDFPVLDWSFYRWMIFSLV